MSPTPSNSRGDENLPWPLGPESYSISDTRPETEGTRQAHSAEDDVDTAEIPTVPPPLPSDVSAQSTTTPDDPFPPLSSSDLSPGEIRDIRMEVTLRRAQRSVDLEFFEKEQQIKQRYDIETATKIEQMKRGMVPDPPAPYEGRLYHFVWLLGRLFLPVLVMIGLLVFVVWGSQANVLVTSEPDAIRGVVSVILWIALSLILIADLWTITHYYVLWNTTIAYSNTASTGIRRKAVGWLKIDGDPPALETKTIITTVAEIRWFWNLVRLNVFVLTLANASEEDSKHFKGIKHVRRGDLIVAKVQEIRSYFDDVPQY